MNDIIASNDIPNLSIDPISEPTDFFFGKEKSEKNFGGSKGIIFGPALSSFEIARMRDLIREQLLETAKNVAPELLGQLNNIELEDYHKITNSNIHSKMFSKLGRILKKSAVQEALTWDFFSFLYQAVGPYELADEENVGHQQISFRIVRPFERSDVGTLHRDAWFWEVFKTNLPPNKQRFKIWVQVGGSSSEAGLLLVPGSHLVDIPYRTETKDGKLNFISAVPKGLSLQRFNAPLGTPVMFNYHNLHSGSLNRGHGCRISFEITILFDRS